MMISCLRRVESQGNQICLQQDFYSKVDEAVDGWWKWRKVRTNRITFLKGHRDKLGSGLYFMFALCSENNTDGESS